MRPKRKYDQKEVEQLWGFSAGYCAFPNCYQPCVKKATEHDKAALVGQICHIVAHSDKGPRADPTMPAEARNRYDNLILLCGTHHNMVDGQPNTYTVNDLRMWKRDLEQWVHESLEQSIGTVTFTELDIVTRAIVANPAGIDPDFRLVAPAEKLRRNGLGDRSYNLFTMGASLMRQVEQYVTHQTVVIPDFPERLTSGFVTEYRRQQLQGLTGDALFEALHRFASGASSQFPQQAAGLGVLVYLFERCEIFER